MQAKRAALTGPDSFSGSLPQPPTAHLLWANRTIIPFLRGKVNARERGTRDWWRV